MLTCSLSNGHLLQNRQIQGNSFLIGSFCQILHMKLNKLNGITNSENNILHIHIILRVEKSNVCFKFIKIPKAWRIHNAPIANRPDNILATIHRFVQLKSDLPRRYRLKDQSHLPPTKMIFMCVMIHPLRALQSPQNSTCSAALRQSSSHEDSL